MKALRRTLHLTAAVTLVTALAALAAPVARAQTYPDVPKGMWARAAIDWATDQGPASNKLLDDYDGVAFKPDRAITRAQLAHALVIAAGHAGDALVGPLPLADTPPQHPYYTDVELAVKLHLLGTYPGGFRPDVAATTAQVNRAIVKLLYTRNPGLDWTMLSYLAPGSWEPNAGWKIGAPTYLPYEVAAHFLNLRRNHPAGTDGLEVAPLEPIDRAEVAYSFYKASQVSSWQLGTALVVRHRRASQAHGEAEADRLVRAQVRWLSVRLGRRVPHDELTLRDAGPRGLRLLRLRVVGDEDHHALPDPRLATHRGGHGGRRQAAHHAQPPRARRHHLLRSQRAQVVGGVCLSRGGVPGPGLVHPLERVRGQRRQPRLPQLVGLELAERLRLGAARPRDGSIIAP